MQVIRLERLFHKGQNQTAIFFKYNPAVKQYVLGIPGVKWSKTYGCFYVPTEKYPLGWLYAYFRKKNWRVDYSDISQTNTRLVLTLRKALELPEATEAIDKSVGRLQQWMFSKRYSSNTIKTYSEALRLFLRFHANKTLDQIDHQDVLQFNTEYILRNKLSASYQNQIVNAIKLFFKTLEGRNLDLEKIHRPKRGRPLPNVLSKEEVKLILEAHGNLKHRMMLILIYACGLRRSELLHLVPTDIDSTRMVLKIRGGKGNKDRITPLSEKLISLLRDYYKAYKPQKWLFEGQQKGQPYSAQSLQSVFKQALLKANIKKPITLHGLRHSYATHLLENGTDLRFIQELLGHKSSRTTEIYTHVSTKSIQNIKSPFDSL